MAEDSVEGAAQQAEDSLEGAAQQAEDSVERAAQQAEDSVERAAQQAEDSVERAAQQAEDSRKRAAQQMDYFISEETEIKPKDTDASRLGIGAALMQIHDGKELPVPYFSRVLKPAETRYSTYEAELLASFEAVKYFDDLLRGRKFTLKVDNSALAELKTRSHFFDGRVGRQLFALNQFDFNIIRIPTQQNPIADWASRHGDDRRLKSNQLERVLNAGKDKMAVIRRIYLADAAEWKLRRYPSVRVITTLGNPRLQAIKEIQDRDMEIAEVKRKLVSEPESGKAKQLKIADGIVYKVKNKVTLFRSEGNQK